MTTRTRFPDSPSGYSVHRTWWPMVFPAFLMLLVGLRSVHADGAPPRETERPNASPVTILVADPLAKELACDCVAGFAQRRYAALAMVLEKRLGRPVHVLYSLELSTYWGEDRPVSLVIGKHSEMICQARELGRTLHPLASLTDEHASTTFRGLFVVRSGNPAQSLADLKGYRILFGPASCEEKHRAAMKALKQAGVAVPDPVETVPSCTDAANKLMALSDEDRVAAVISDYAKILLEGCHTIPAGSLRVVGTTEALPFITVFATDEVPPALRRRIRKELLEAKRFSALLRLLQSKEGFKPIETKGAEKASAREWIDFRGPQRSGLVASLPDTLEDMHTVWAAPMVGRGLGGIAVTGRWVFVTDRDEEARVDYLKMLDAQSGRLRFTGELVNPAGFLTSRELDYGNSVRTTPVVSGDRVYVLDAFGTLYVWYPPQSEAFAPSGRIRGVSTAALVDDFELITWGVSATPLVVSSPGGGTRLIVNSCSATHTLLGLDADLLTPHWLGPGQSTGYASCIAGSFGGRLQIVGYDTRSLGGWDPDTGERLWTVPLEEEEDYIVPTPVALDQWRLLVVSESNCLRIYRFDEQGLLLPEPVATNEEITTDTVTPVAVAGKAYCTSAGALYQIDTNHRLQTTWSMSDDAFSGHVSLIADVRGRRLLVTTFSGELLLFDISGDTPVLISRRTVFLPGEQEEIFSHPSVVGNRIYLRGLNSLKCVHF